MSNKPKVSDELLKKAIDESARIGYTSVKDLMFDFNINKELAEVLMEVLIGEGVVEDFDGSDRHPFLGRVSINSAEPSSMKSEEEIRARIEELEARNSSGKIDNSMSEYYENEEVITALKWVLGEDTK